MGGMRSTIAVSLFLLALAGCRGTFGGYDPEAPVDVWVQASEHLNAARTEGRPVDLYAFRVRNPSKFLHAPVEELVSGDVEVPGAVFLERRFLRPGGSFHWLLPAMETAPWDTIGILATYGSPNEVRRVTGKIPEGGGFDLDLGPSDVRYFGPARHSDEPLVPGPE